MRSSLSLKTLNTTWTPNSFRQARTVSTAISAARSGGKRNSPVEMQQKATLSMPCSAARARQER